MNNAGPPRVFIGLKVAPKLAQQLAELARALKSDEVRLVPSSDIHLTLVPPWNETHITGAVEKLRIAVCGSGASCWALNIWVRPHTPAPASPLGGMRAQCRTRGVAHGALGRIWPDGSAAVPAACHPGAHPEERGLSPVGSPWIKICHSANTSCRSNSSNLPLKRLAAIKFLLLCR